MNPADGQGGPAEAEEAAERGAAPKPLEPGRRAELTRGLLWLVAVGIVVWAAFVVFEYRPMHRPILGFDGVARRVPSTVLAASLLTLAGTALGSAAVRRLSLVDAPDERLLLGFALGSGALAWVSFSLGAFGWLRPVLVWPVVLASLVLGIRPLLSDVRALAARSRPALPGVAHALGLLGLLLLLASLAPAHEWDELAYHLPLPQRAAQTGRFALAGDDFSYYPQLCESLTAAGLVLGGSIRVGRVLHWIYAAALARLVFVASRDLAPERRGARWMSLAILCVEPVFVATASIAGVDLALTFFALLAVRVLLSGRPDDRRTALLAGVLAGFACGTSFRGLMAAVAVSAAAIVAGRARSLPLFGVGAAVGAAPWYARNFLATGNPLFPFLAGVFPTRPLPTGLGALGWPDVARHAISPPTESGLDWVITTLRLPWDATVLGRSSTYGRFGGDMSPLYLALVPLLFVVDWRRLTRPLAVWCAYALAHSVLWAVSPSSYGTRYQLSVLAVAALAIPAVIRLARTLAVQRAALAVTVILSGVLYVGALHRMTSRSDFDHVFGQLSTRDYLRSMPDGSLFEMTLALDADPPRPGPVLMIGEKRSLYLKRPFIPDFDLDNVGALYRNGGGTAEGMAALLRRSGVHDILEHSIMARELLRPEERRAYNEMVSLFTETKAQDSYLVWRTVRD